MNRLLPITTACFLFVCSSCDQWFDIKPKNENIDQDKLFTNENAFLNGLAGIYTELRRPEIYGEHLSVATLEFMAQNFVPQSEQQKQASAYDYSSSGMRPVISDIWMELYRNISYCNNLLLQIENTNVVFNFTGQKEIITGELYALRGALHFELLRMFHPHPSVDASFCGIPYMTRFGLEVSAPQSTGQILEAATADLKKAATLLSDNDPVRQGAASFNTVLPGQIDPRLRSFQMNYYAVTAELARLYLYQGNFEEAYHYADTTFGHIRNVPPTKQVFYYYAPGKEGADLSFSREHIFAIASGPEGLTNVSEKMFETGKTATRQGFSACYPIKDTRYRVWFAKDETDGQFIMAPKFSKESLLIGYISNGEGADKTFPVRIPFIKLGEISLIAAEALNELSRTTEAADWLIEMQGFRDVTTVKEMKESGTLTQAILRQEIRAEYLREFYGEGQLFFFYKRMNDKKITKYDGTEIDMPQGKYTFPIPADGLTAH